MSAQVHRFDVAALPATPWKNGGGSTREIASWPPGAGFEGFDWRVSIASIAASGPFSQFAGVDRIITLLEGEGVRLRGEDLDHRLGTPLAPFAFSGDARIDCTLLGGACSDFNVMTRRGRLRAVLRVLHRAAELPAAPHGLLLAWRGRWRAGGEALAPGQGLWWSDAATGWALDTADADADLLAVQWRTAD
jgi:environmental stress-induced protein Ves